MEQQEAQTKRAKEQVIAGMTPGCLRMFQSRWLGTGGLGAGQRGWCSLPYTQGYSSAACSTNANIHVVTFSPWVKSLVFAIRHTSMSTNPAGPVAPADRTVREGEGEDLIFWLTHPLGADSGRFEPFRDLVVGYLFTRPFL